MTSPASSAAQSAVAPETPDAERNCVQPRLRAKSVPTALPLAPVAPPSGGPESPIPPQAREALGRLLAAFAIPKGTNVLHSCGLHAAHVRHREAAAHWDAAAVRVLRRAWGWVHLLVKACLLEPLDWVTESPARTTAAVIVYLLVTHWL